MNTFRRRILSNWNVMRILRVILGLWVLVMAVRYRDTTMIFLSTFMVLTAVFGVGCCGINGCYVQPGSDAEKSAGKGDYEEIK